MMYHNAKVEIAYHYLKPVDLPLHRFENYSVDIPRQIVARRVIQLSKHLQPLPNLMDDRLLDGIERDLKEVRG